MNEPIRQHYIPEMLSRRFVDDSGRLYFFNKSLPHKGVLQSTPRKLFAERYLYSIVDAKGLRDQRVEKFFTSIENKAGPIIEKIVAAARGGHNPELTASEKADWDRFVYHQWVRVPDSYERVASLKDADDELTHWIDEYERVHRPLSNNERKLVEDSGQRKRIVEGARALSLTKSGPDALRILGEKGLGVAVIRHPKKAFVIGSFPIVKLTSSGVTHLSDPSVEAWLSIASDVAVTPSGRRGEESIVDIESRHVRALNEALYRQSKIIAGRSRSLISSLANRSD